MSSGTHVWDSLTSIIIIFLVTCIINWMDYPGASPVRNLPVNAGDMGLMPGLGGSPGEGNGNPLQYSSLGNPMDRGGWWARVHEFAQSPTGHTDRTTTLLIWYLIHLFLSFLKIQRWQKANDISYAVVQAKENPSFGETSLAVQWLRLCVSNAGGMRSIPSWGIEVLHAVELGENLEETPSSGVFIFNQLIQHSHLGKLIHS